MNNIEKELIKERKISHKNRKILRIKPLIWIQRYWLIFSLIFILIITTLLGIYDVEKIVYSSLENGYVDESKVLNLIEDHLGKNYFLINPQLVKQDILENSYVKDVKVEKVFPNKLKIDIDEYKTFLLFSSEESCNIFALEGVLLTQNEGIDCEEYAKENDLIYFEGDETHFVQENGKKYFYLSDEISDISKILEEFDLKITNITLKENILNIETTSVLVIFRINDDIDGQLAKMYLVLEELVATKKEAVSIDVRFQRPVIVIDK